MVTQINLEKQIAERLLERNQILEDFFSRHAHAMAVACQEMAQRFLRGGRLLALGRGASATDAQHVTVEFGQDVGQAELLYHFLGQNKQETSTIVDEVTASIRLKVHDDTLLRARLAAEESDQICATTEAIHDRLAQNGKLIIFGNGGSAT